ncbi:MULTISPECIES: DUF695 domain-containing protein [Myxococcaceae]|uniref:DUF695 domain-containing protein n=1 Tax=Myxococcaceae TaxID=31 RepID=UPI00188F3133|nr:MULTISPECIES: DUF695 domain-containing protein [Myxococcaceae]MBF5045684.1 DUF695 domain-containing protein [Simulacricoccus sp. 17bor-14]
MTSFLRTTLERLTQRLRPQRTTPPPAPARAVIPLRPLAPEVAERIAAFWRWFSAERPRFEHAVRMGLNPELQELLGAEVSALHPELHWELGRARDGVIDLSLTAEGNFPLRKLTEAWCQAAPHDLQGWRFHPARPPTPGATAFTLNVAGQDAAIADLRCALEPDDARARLNLRVWHPAFAALEPEARSMVAFLSLDALLGEDDVERWVGGIQLVEEAAEAFVPPAELQARVAALAAAPRDTFSFLQGKNPQGRAAMATLNLALKRLDHLAYEDQLVVTIAYRNADAQGIPPAEEHQAAQALEDTLVESLAGLALHYGHVVSGGRLEVLFYVADKRAAEGKLAAWRGRAQGWQVQRTWHHDPEWKALLKW